MSLDEIATEHLRTINGSWDYHIDTRHGFDDISMDKIAVLIDKIEKNRGRPFEDSFLTVLQKYELIRGGEITFGAYLLFVENFSAITAMQLGRFKSETKIIDNLDLSTDLFSEIEKTIEFIKKHLMVEYIITGKPQREERYDYPLEAVREIVINMVVHRDYRDSGNSVIKIFDDRIEFFNPGKLYDDITVEKLISGNYSSRTRNRLIANIFKDCGLIERYGSGIKRIRNECFKYGIEEPLFEEFQHGFRVILFKKHKFRQENNDGGVNVGDGGVSVGDGGVNSDSEIFIFIKENPGCKSSLISADSGHSKRTVERSLRRLREQNLIEFQGSSKKGGYFVVGDGGVNGGDGGVSVGDGGVSVGDGGVNSDNEIFIFIKENPGCKSSLISADSGHSKRTVERSLRRLREQNLIEFQGSSKKGGYFVVGDGGVSGGVSGGVNGGVNGKH
jgi:ATP-dependent DNA helicase RecG